MRYLSPPSHTSVASRLTWVAAGTVIVQVLTLVKIGVMARVLSPDQLGVYALLMAYAQGSSRFNGFGIAAAIVHFRDLSDRELNTLLYLGVGIATLTFVVTLIVVGVLEPDGVLLLFGGIGFSLVIRAPGEHVEALLQAQHQHATLAKVVIGSAFVGEATAVAGLYSTGSLASVVFGYLVTASTYSAFLLAVPAWRENRTSWRMRPLWKMRSVLRFSAYQFASGLGNLVLHRADRFVLLFSFGLPVLGEYELAKQLVLRPYKLLGAIVARVYFPIYAELQDDRKRVSALYLRVLRSIVGLTAPAYLLLAIYAPQVTALILGDRLVYAGELVRVLCFLGFSYSVINPIGSYLLGLGKAKAELLFQCTIATWLGLLLLVVTRFADLMTSMWIYSLLGGAGVMVADLLWRRRIGGMSTSVQAVGLAYALLWAALLALIAMSTTVVLASFVSPDTRPGLLAQLVLLGVLYGSYALLRIRAISLNTLPPPSADTGLVDGAAL